MTTFTPHYQFASNPNLDESYADLQREADRIYFASGREETEEVKAAYAAIQAHPGHVYAEARSYSKGDGNTTVFVSPKGSIEWTPNHLPLPQGAVVIGEYRNGGVWYAKR